MKYILLPILILLFNNSVQAQLEQHPHIGSQIKECKLKVKNIDEQVHYKTIYVPSSNTPYTTHLEKSPESWDVLYFDKNGSLIKVKNYYYAEGECLSTYYFENDVVIYTNHTESIPGEEQFASSYIQFEYIKNRKHQYFLATQFTRYWEGMLALRIFTLSDKPFPTAKYYEGIYDINSRIANVTENIFGVDSLHIPPADKIIPVRLIPPKAGDTTSILYHEAPLYEKPSSDAPVIAELKVGDVSMAFGKTRFSLGTQVNVIEVIDDEWCKVEAHDLNFGRAERNFQGYIQTQFLTPIEVTQ